MTESTARASLFELQSSMSPTYTWAVPQKPVCVRIPFPVIDRLEQAAVESFKSLSSRGSEIGGLLFGTVKAGQPAEVTIEDYEMIACDYSRGPLYRLAEADMARFDRASLQHATSSQLAVIGMFRSHTRKTLSLDTDDIALLDSRFREPHQIALLIRPFATKTSTAGIFIREGGAFQGETSPLEFPFRSSLLSSEKPVIEAPETKPAPSATSSGMPSPASPKTTMRGQIVPIASRREGTPSIPAMPVEAAIPAKPAEPELEPAVTARAASPAVSEPPQPAPAPAPQVENKVSKPAVEEKTSKPKTDDKAAKPQVDDKASKPRTEDRGPKPRTDDKAVKPKTEDKSVKPKPEENVKPKVEEKAVPAKVAATAVLPLTPPAKSNKKLLWIGLGAAVPIILLIVLLAYPPFLHRNRPSGSPQDSSSLSLRVERTGGEILLTWNRDSETIRSATQAVLLISDGDQHDKVEMDLAQLRNGSISYSPATSDVVFKMEVTGRGNEKTASESVRVLRTRPSPMTSDTGTPQTGANGAGKTPANNVPVTPNAPNTPNATAPNSTPSQPNNATAANNAATPATPNAAPPEETQTKSPVPLKPFQAPSLSARLHPANPADLPDAPSLGGVQTNSGGSSVSGLMNSVSAPVAPPKPGAPAPPAATPTPAADKKGAPQGGQLVQAVLVTRKDPEYPKLARETGAKGIVELIATIGTDGKVKAVKVVHGPQMLQKAASDAVLQWKYKPTMLNGVAVEAQTQVFVNFLGNDR